MQIFEEYLKEHNLEALTVAVKARIRYMTVYNATKGFPITPEHARLLRQTVFSMSGAPSAKRSKQVSQVQFLLVKVSLPGSSRVAVLTYDEVACIDYALSVFTQQVREKIPQSISREGVLESCEGLREYLVKSLTSLDQNHRT